VRRGGEKVLVGLPNGIDLSRQDRKSVEQGCTGGMWNYTLEEHAITHQLVGTVVLNANGISPRRAQLSLQCGLLPPAAVGKETVAIRIVKLQVGLPLSASTERACIDRIARRGGEKVLVGLPNGIDLSRQVLARCDLSCTGGMWNYTLEEHAITHQL